MGAALKHTWKLKENSWLLKYYYFWYPETDKTKRDNLSFCRLFWSVICGPLMLFGWILIGILIGILMGIVYPFAMLDEKVKERKTAKQRATKVAEKAEKSASRFSMFVKSHPKFFKFLGWSLLTIIGLAVLSFAIWGLCVLISYWHCNWNWGVWDWTSGIIGSIIALALIGGLIGWAIANTAFVNWLSKIFTPVGHFSRAIFRFFAMGYYSVKNNTCPRIEIEK